MGDTTARQKLIKIRHPDLSQQSKGERKCTWWESSVWLCSVKYIKPLFAIGTMIRLFFALSLPSSFRYRGYRLITMDRSAELWYKRLSNKRIDRSRTVPYLPPSCCNFGLSVFRLSRYSTAPRSSPRPKTRGEEVGESQRFNSNVVVVYPRRLLKISFGANIPKRRVLVVAVASIATNGVSRLLAN